MKLISFDVGTRNLAYCLVEFGLECADNGSGEYTKKMTGMIDDWDVLDLGGAGITAEKCSLVLTRVLNETFKDIASLNIDYVLIERQPKRSVSMLAVQMFLCQYFSSHVHNGHVKCVHFVSPKLKLDHSCLGGILGDTPVQMPPASASSSSPFRGRARYAKNKKDAICITRHILEHVLVDHAKLVEFDAATKRDDLADSFLQSLCWTLCTKEFKGLTD